jgi:hypothetical protein
MTFRLQGYLNQRRNGVNSRLRLLYAENPSSSSRKGYVQLAAISAEFFYRGRTRDEGGYGALIDVVTIKESATTAAILKRTTTVDFIDGAGNVYRYNVAARTPPVGKQALWVFLLEANFTDNTAVI